MDLSPESINVIDYLEESDIVYLTLLSREIRKLMDKLKIAFEHE